MPKVASKRSELEARIPVACAVESLAVEFLEEQRGWKNDADAYCPHCGVVGESRRMKAKDGSRNSRYLWRCGDCKRQFTYKVGTVMEDSPIPARHWCLTFFRMASSKKGVSALQIQRETGLSYKSALFMCHRVRWAAAPANEQEPQLGSEGQIVEYDETYVGGKPRGHARYHVPVGPDGNRRKGKRADFDDRKTPVVGGIERDGRVKAKVVYGLTSKELAHHVTTMVHPDAHLQTDQAQAYKAIGQEFASHDRIRHNQGVYVRYNEDGTMVTTNSIEGFWSLLKKRIHGTHTSVSRKHLHRYVSEQEFIYNNRDLNDGDRTVKLIQAAELRRLTYKQQTSKNRDQSGRFTDR